MYGTIQQMSLAPITSDRLTLRPLSVDDTDAVFAVLGHQPTVSEVSWGHTNRADTENWLNRRRTDERTLGYSMWAIQLLGSDTLVGLCGFFATDRPSRIELGYVIHADQWGKGYATEAAGASVSAARAAGLEVVATIRPTNERSLAVAARIGLVHTGTIEDERGELFVWEQRDVASGQGPLEG